MQAIASFLPTSTSITFPQRMVNSRESFSPQSRLRFARSERHASVEAIDPTVCPGTLQ